jgi:hypothetical protein
MQILLQAWLRQDLNKRKSFLAYWRDSWHKYRAPLQWTTRTSMQWSAKSTLFRTKREFADEASFSLQSISVTLPFAFRIRNSTEYHVVRVKLDQRKQVSMRLSRLIIAIDNKLISVQDIILTIVDPHPANQNCIEIILRSGKTYRFEFEGQILCPKGSGRPPRPSNFEYLMELNRVNGFTFNDSSRFLMLPIFNRKVDDSHSKHYFVSEVTEEIADVPIDFVYALHKRLEAVSRRVIDKWVTSKQFSQHVAGPPRLQALFKSPTFLKNADLPVALAAFSGRANGLVLTHTELMPVVIDGSQLTVGQRTEVKWRESPKCLTPTMLCSVVHCNTFECIDLYKTQRSGSLPVPITHICSDHEYIATAGERYCWVWSKNNLFAPLYSIQGVSGHIVCLAMSVNFDLIVIGRTSGKLQFHSLRTGVLLRMTTIYPPKLIRITPAWGFVLIYSEAQQSLVVMDSNATKIRENYVSDRFIQCEVCRTPAGFDVAVLTTTSGSVFMFDPYYCQIGKPLFKRLGDIVSVSLSWRNKTGIVILRDKRMLAFPFPTCYN